MANIDDGVALSARKDYSNVGSEDVHVTVRLRANSKLRNWDQFFTMFRKQVRKPTAELLAHVETIDLGDISVKLSTDKGLIQCCKDVIHHIEEMSKKIGIDLFLEKELLNNASQQLMERTVFICLFGRFNSGKSTMINAILGNEVLPTSMMSQTTTPIKVVHREDLHTGPCTMTCSERKCPVLTEVNWREGQADNALDTNQPICGAQRIRESLKKFDEKVKRNKSYKGFPDLLIEAHVQPFSGSSVEQKVYLVDTQGIGAATTQHREALAALFLKQSSAYVYCVKYGETEDFKNQEDYKAIAAKDRSVFTSGRFIVAITHFDEHYHRRHRSLPVEVQKNHIVDGINDAVGIQFSPDNIVCVSGQMALCARQLCFTQNQHVIRDAEDYLRYSPEFSGPMGQDSKINDKDFPTVAKFLQKNSGILEFEKCIKEMVYSSNNIWLQALYGDCSRFIRDARQLIMTKLVILQEDGEGKDKIYQEKLKSQTNLARQLTELEKTLQFSRKDSEAYASLEDAYDEEVEDMKEEASQMVALFKEQCIEKVQQRYHPKDLQSDTKTFLKEAHKALIENHLLKHIYEVLPILGQAFGKKHQELADATIKYADITVSSKGIAWPPGLTTTKGSHIVEDQPNLSEIIKQIPLIQPFEGSRLEAIFHTIWETISRPFSYLNQQKVNDVLEKLERNLIAVCEEYMRKAKVDIVKFFFKRGYADRVITLLERFIEKIQDKLKVADEELNNLAKAVYFMKVSVRVCRDVDTFLDELNKGLCNSYRKTMGHDVCMV